MALAASGPVMAAPGPSPPLVSLSFPPGDQHLEPLGLRAPCSPAPRSARFPRAPRAPSRAPASSGGLGARQLRGEAGRAQFRPPARGGSRTPARPLTAAPGLALSAPPLPGSSSKLDSRRRERGPAGVPEGRRAPYRTHAGPRPPGKRGARPHAPPWPEVPRPPRGGLARSSRPPRLGAALPATARQPSRPDPGPAPRLADVPAEQRPPAVPGAPGAARPRDTHHPRFAGLPPHSAPGPDPRTCCWPRSPLSGWA